MHIWHLWRYPLPDVAPWGGLLFGEDGEYTRVPSFVFCCYFFYTTWVVTLVRALREWFETPGR
jgi:hypothetical protein